MQNGSSVEICTRCIHVFCTFDADLYAQTVPSNKISASELRRKFIKSALLVGHPELTVSTRFQELRDGMCVWVCVCV